jgi:L-amino acid N-acyltransferase YncA
MKSNEIKVRMAVLEDAEEILNIYAPYVTDSAISFEYRVPSLAEFKKRMIDIKAKYPYLVAESDGHIIGYCYASSFKNRAAYDWSVETTIYLKSGFKGKGTGRLLYKKLEAILEAQHILNLNACIAYPHPESIAFHEKLGYKTVAHFHQCGYKAGVWYDMVWMEKMLGSHEAEPLEVIPADKVEETFL